MNINCFALGTPSNTFHSNQKEYNELSDWLVVCCQKVSGLKKNSWMNNSIPNSWLDPGTGKTFSFSENGSFVDSEGNGPQKGFKNDNNFSDWLHSYVQQKLLEEGLLIKEVSNNIPIFHTPDAFHGAKKLLVLICGIGRIMAGLWSVGVCAYHGLNAGSVLPCIYEAKKRNMEVIILNPNYSKLSMLFHVETVFNELIIPSNVERIWIIAHSMGGWYTCSFISKNPQWCIEHISAFALTDGIEPTIHAKGFLLHKWSHLKGINWIRSNEPLNKQLVDGSTLQHRSAETNDHPLTTLTAFPFIWEFFDENGANSDKSSELTETFIADDENSLMDNYCFIA